MKRKPRGTRLELDLPEGARLIMRRPPDSKLYSPFYVRFPDGSISSRWEGILAAYGVDVVDVTNPRIIELM